MRDVVSYVVRILALCFILLACSLAGTLAHGAEDSPNPPEVPALPAPPDPLASGGLIAEVMGVAEGPHVYDFRRSLWEITLGYGQVWEHNNFDNDTYDLGVGVPVGAMGLARLSLRKVFVSATPSSTDLGRTPFRQEAQSTRYEMAGAFHLPLIEGRSMTRLSPHFPDVESMVFGVLGAHYALPSRSAVPKLRDRPHPMPGQSPVEASVAIEVGLRWAIYWPTRFGVYIESLYERAVRGGGQDLKGWFYGAGGVAWAFGAS